MFFFRIGPPNDKLKLNVFLSLICFFAQPCKCQAAIWTLIVNIHKIIYITFGKRFKCLFSFIKHTQIVIQNKLLNTVAYKKEQGLPCCCTSKVHFHSGLSKSRLAMLLVSTRLNKSLAIRTPLDIKTVVVENLKLFAKRP